MAASEIIRISDEEKDFLQNHLDDLKFVNDNVKMKAYSCCACRKLAIRHCIANCMDVFCNTCYDHHYMQPCPYCKETVATNLQDPEFERAVFEIEVECKFRKNGCKEIVVLRNFLNHIHACSFSTDKLLPILYKEDINFDDLQQLKDDVNRIKQVMESLQGENRRICCDFQEFKDLLKNAMDLQTSTFVKLTEEIHNEDATDQLQADIMQLKIALKNNEDAGKALQDKHNSQIEKIQELAGDEVRIKYTTELVKSQINQLTIALKESEDATKEVKAEHEKEIQKIESLQRQYLEDLETKLSAQFRNELTECQYLQEGDFIGSPPAVVLWKVAGVQKKLRDFKNDKCIKIRSEEFFNVSEGLNFKPGLWIYSQVKWVSMALEFTDDLKDKSNTSLVYLHSRKYILLDQSNAIEKNNIELIDRPKFGMNSTEKMLLPLFSSSHFFPHHLLEGANRYLKNDQMLIKIIIKPISFLYRNVASCDGIFVWHIENYLTKKRAEIDGVQEYLISNPFKTSEAGYLLQVELFLNGYDRAKGQFLSVFSRVIMGENDAHLPCPFTYKCSYYLLDQSDSQTKHHITLYANSITVDRNNPLWGFNEFVHQSQAEDQQYLKGDSILIKVVAQLL